MDFRLAAIDDLQQIKIVYKEIIKSMDDNQIQIWDDIYPCDFFEEDIKNNEQQGGIFPKDGPQVDSSSSKDTKVGSGKFRRQALPCHAHLSPVPSQTYQPVSQGLTLEGEEKKGVQNKKNLHKTVRFQIDKQPEVLHPVVDDEEAVDSLSVLSSTVYKETVFIEEDEFATKEKCIPKRDENSRKFCVVFQPPMPKGQGLKFFFCLLDLI